MNYAEITQRPEVPIRRKSELKALATQIQLNPEKECNYADY